MGDKQETKQSNNSWFVTIPGLLALLFFTVIAIYFRARVIGAFLCFFFLICLASRCWSRGVLNRVRFDAEPVISSCHVGETLKLNMKVRNFSFFPLVWLDVILPLGHEELACLTDDDTVFHFTIEGSDLDWTGIRDRFVWILWQQEIAWEEDLRALRRGYCLITQVRLMAGDGFGLSAQRRPCLLKKPFELIIYPRMFEVDIDPFLKFSEEAVARSSGQQEDVTILKGSRPYSPGDPVKRVNWRLLAESGRMEINMFETVLPGCAAFILDILSFHKMVSMKAENGSAADILVPKFLSEEFEIMISFIASCIHGIAERGIAPALIIPSYRDHEAEVVFPNVEEEDEARCMETLAKIAFEGRKNNVETGMIHFPWEDFWDLSHNCGDVYICSLNEETAEYGQLADELGEGKVHRVFLRPPKTAAREDALYVEDLMPAAFSEGVFDESKKEEA